MIEYGVIRLHSDDRQVEWIRAQSDGTRLSGIDIGSLSDAKKALGELPIIALVPATEVLTTRVNLPVRSPAKIRAALPYALEEDLAEDIDGLHFAAGEREANNDVPVAVVSHERLQNWLTMLEDASIEASRMVAENHGLASIPGSLSLLIDHHCTMFNDGAETEFVMQMVKPSDVLVAAGVLQDSNEDDDGAEKGSTHLLAFCDADTNEAVQLEWNALRHELDSVDVNIVPDGVFAKLAVGAATGLGVNLLQGVYGKKTEYGTLLRPWRLAAGLFLAVFLVGFGSKIVDYYRLVEERDALREQFTTEFRAIRPTDTREIRDPVNTVRSLLRSAGSDSNAPQVFLPSMGAIGAAVANNNTAKLEVISYRAGVTDIRLTAPDVPTLDRIQSEISSAEPLTATIQSTDNVADRINGRIQVKESGS